MATRNYNFFDSDKKTPTGFPIDKNGVPRTHYGQNALSTGRKSKERIK